MADFEEAIVKVLEHEGGWVDNPADPGGATNRGITFKLFKRYAEGLGLPKTKEALKGITERQAKEIYLKEFWAPMRGDEFKDQQVAEIVFDFYVNVGKPALEALQEVIGVEQDGEIGPVTISILNWANPFIVFEGYRDHRREYYERLVAKKPSLRIFLKGWLNRTNKFVYKQPIV